jgi:hypothetical protein
MLLGTYVYVLGDICWREHQHILGMSATECMFLVCCWEHMCMLLGTYVYVVGNICCSEHVGWNILLGTYVVLNILFGVLTF